MERRLAEAADDEGLAGRVAIVTGASADGDGLTNGRAAALLLGRAGARVVCVGRRPGPVQRTVELITAAGGEAVAVAADVSAEMECRRVVDEALRAFGRVDLLDNNVGIAHRGNLLATPLATWRKAWEVNVESIVSMCRFAIPAMAEAGGGAIVNIGSLRGLRPLDEVAYATTKGALISLTRALAVAHGVDGVRVNCVVVGPVFTDSPMGRSLSAEQRDARRRASPLGVEGTSWDTANAVRFLLSDRAAFVTGQALVVDGGVGLVSPRR